MNQKPPPTESIAQFLTSVGYTSIPFRQNITGNAIMEFGTMTLYLKQP